MRIRGLLATTVILILMWLPIQACVSIVSGWNALAKNYQAHDIPPHWDSVDASISLRRDGKDPFGFTKIVRLHSDSNGLFLALSPAFRPWKPPLEIPWTEFKSCQESARWGADDIDVEMRLARPAVAVTLKHQPEAALDLCDRVRRGGG